MFLKKIILIYLFLFFGLFTFLGCFQADLDTDQDGIADSRDNCVDIKNYDQSDSDGDGFGDSCDNCPDLTFVRFSDQTDSDGDGVGDICDNCINVANKDQSDVDSDGIGDACSKEADSRSMELLSKASADECFYGVGAPNEYVPDGFDSQACLSSGGTPKTNESYIWGMTKADDMIFFGTNANARCFNVGNAETYDTEDLWVCEKSEEHNVNPVVQKDHRPPSMYLYDTKSGQLKKLKLRPEDISLQKETTGIRAAGNHNGVVFLAGPTTTKPKRIIFFAFDAKTGEPIGAKKMPYINIRQWVTVNDKLYTGVSNPDRRGELLKWTGTAENPFRFETVGKNIGNSIIYLAFHEDRIYVTTRFYGTLAFLAPSVAVDRLDDERNGDMAVWMSPKIDGELNADQADQWEKVWSIFDYEPDEMCGLLSGGGAMASYKGWLYWSNINIKNQAMFYKMTAAALSMSPADRAFTEKGAYRAISVFRGKDLDKPSSKQIELLYGEEFLNTYVPGKGWQLVANKMKQKPKYGRSGFGNLANNYAWTMQVYKDKLYLGTMDELGADLYCFPDADSGALPVSMNGLGNMANFGIRTMVADDEYLYMGTANHYSLSRLTAEELIEANPVMTDFLNPAQLVGIDASGGWELIRLGAE